MPQFSNKQAAVKAVVSFLHKLAADACKPIGEKEASTNPVAVRLVKIATTLLQTGNLMHAIKQAYPNQSNEWASKLASSICKCVLKEGEIMGSGAALGAGLGGGAASLNPVQTGSRVPQVNTQTRQTQSTPTARLTA